jgi:hypothetical protein
MNALFLSVGLALALLQGSVTSTASISGSVREAGSQAAIPDARVTLSGPGVRESATTDAAGRFTFTGLLPGRYAFVVDKEGFAFDQAISPRVAVVAGRASVAAIEMQRAAVIVGQVRDDRGNPRGGVSVHALRTVPSGGTEAVPGPVPRTNDLGEFRVDRLPPGEYLVLAAPPDTRVNGTALMPTYYPSTTDQKLAGKIQVGPGGAAVGIFIEMIAATAYEITGTVVDEQGRPRRAMITFVSQSVQTWAPGQSASMRARVSALVTRPDGTFRITGLGPGTYRLTPMVAPDGPPQQLPMDVMTAALNGNRSTVNVDVRDGNISGVRIVLSAN